MIRRHSFLLSLLAVGTLAAATPAATSAAEPLDVVASFSILGDVVRQLGGDRVRVTTLVGPDSDAHVYQPTPADARAVAQTKLLVVNGLAFEGWMDRLIGASGYKGPVVTASAGVERLKMEELGHEPVEEGKHDEPDTDASDKGVVDPHAWQSLVNARIYARNIAEGLIQADPSGARAYRANAAHYLKEIAAVETEIHITVDALPAERRKVVTSHDAFGYFAAAYGIEFHAPVGVSTEVGASAGDVAKLIRQIKNDKIPAVFVENISDSRLLNQIVRETGARIGGKLFSDALSSPQGPAATYLDMMRHNIRTLAAAMGV